MRLGSEEATARRDASVGETDHCHNCGVVFVPKDDPPVVITDGGSDNDDGTLVVRCYCGHQCAKEAGFPWAGLPSSSEMPF